jgi:hypothetical protein
VGFILFAAIMMIIVGIWQALQGLIAIFENEFYVATRNYLFEFDATAWGWIHLLIGLLVALAGWGLLSGRTWARAVAITLAVLSAIANFLFILDFRSFEVAVEPPLCATQRSVGPRRSGELMPPSVGEQGAGAMGSATWWSRRRTSGSALACRRPSRRRPAVAPGRPARQPPPSR